ncbi:DUF4132 domain-containing protein [Virgisporangium aurantiacum]|uniref:DUF4132 domain-containing protein n=1 Tax=Virgisporangium aurantiacum TaxID=175570 RepID=A0A8J3ZB70_9ACTN|nr:DUF4132 domain-containing protein [Virgisporangium aurantiacum]GIJ60751.1 hypothetical protein Vau01_082670 [Virgisporangium aurantiacum]
MSGFEWPPKWRGRVLPRRGGSPAVRPDPRPDPPAATPASTLARRGDRIRAALARPGHEPDVVEEGLRAVPMLTLSRRTLAADTGPEPTPFGVAVGLLAGLAAVPWAGRDELDGVADLVFGLRGPVFAARTVAELGGLWVDGPVIRNAHTIVRRTGAEPPAEPPPSWYRFAADVRRLLGTVPDDVHADVVRALAAYRDGDPAQRAAVSFLVPDQHAWVDADIAAVAGTRSANGGATEEAWLLLFAARTAAQAAALADGMAPWQVVHDEAAVATLVDGVGPAVAPILDGWVDGSYVGTDNARALLSVIARLPGDEAYTALMARAGERLGRAALLDATRRFPARALRLLAAAPADRVLDRILRDTVLTNPAAVDEVLSTVDTVDAEDAMDGPAATDRIRRVRDEATAVVEAAPEALPPVLVRPPWTVRRKRSKPVVVAGLTAGSGTAMAWRDGERERWLAHRDQLPRHPGVDWLRVVRRFGGQMDARHEEILVGWGPEDLVRPLVGRTRGWWVAEPERWVSIAVARFELDALPHVRARAEKYPASEGRFLLPYATADLAVLMAGWYTRLRSGRAAAVQWLDRHAALAARTLVPPALGKAGPARREAERALRMLAGRAHDVTVREAAATYGPAAADGIAALLDTDPLDVLPARVPTPPGWIDARLLPPVPLRGGDGVLPPDAVGHIVTMLAMSRPDDPYAGIDVVTNTCDPAALADLGWALFERWLEADAPSADGWVLPALGLIGDDETVRRLAPLIRAWPGEGGHARAVVGLDALRAIGTDVALMHLYGISETVKFAGLRDKARERIAEIADDLGLSAAELADRLVPDFGLDGDGGMVLDFGPRRFTVGFDEQLKPYVVDGSGKRRANLPKPGAGDDPGLAPAAAKRFAALRKDVRTAAGDQLRRLERAMVSGRRWSAGDFATYLAGHPLVRHIVRRLVWTTDTGGSFRVAEDGTYADASDDTYALPPDASVAVAHPVGLGPATKAWAEVFTDYEILQPFPQLGRETFALTDAERAATSLERWSGRIVPTGTLLGLERRGWRRADPQDAGNQPWFERDAPGGDRLLIMIDPGIPVGSPTDIPEQCVGTVVIVRSDDYEWQPRYPQRIGTLDDVTASELIRDMQEVVQ